MWEKYKNKNVSLVQLLLIKNGVCSSSPHSHTHTRTHIQTHTASHHLRRCDFLRLEQNRNHLRCVISCNTLEIPTRWYRYICEYHVCGAYKYSEPTPGNIFPYCRPSFFLIENCIRHNQVPLCYFLCLAFHHERIHSHRYKHTITFTHTHTQVVDRPTEGCRVTSAVFA